jgi:pimeloyl-ACP methyl ester carboxylesterase
MRFSLNYRQSTVSYLRFGSGSRLLICFHGFGDRAVIFYNLEKKMGKDFTLIAIDLPFHGQTEWREKTIQIIDFELIIKEILKTENVERFSLAGFSFGARIVAKLLFSQGNLIDSILLFSPDGFGTKGLKTATLFPIFFRRFMRFLLQKPDKIVRLINFLHQKQLVNKSVQWFFSQNINNTQRRERLFAYWLALNDFEVKLPVFKKKLQETGITTHIFLGKHDDITPLSIGTFLTDGAPNVQLHIVDSDHQILGHLPDFNSLF